MTRTYNRDTGELIDHASYNHMIEYLVSCKHQTVTVYANDILEKQQYACNAYTALEEDNKAVAYKEWMA